MSLCNQLGFRRLRPASAQPGVIWREPKAFPVPKVAPQRPGGFDVAWGRNLLGGWFTNKVMGEFKIVEASKHDLNLYLN